MHGILYLDRAPKLADAVPTAIANTIAKTKHISIRGSENAIEKNFFAPFFIQKFTVSIKNAKDSAADSTATAELTSHKKGR